MRCVVDGALFDQPGIEIDTGTDGLTRAGTLARRSGHIAPPVVFRAHEARAVVLDSARGVAQEIGIPDGRVRVADEQTVPQGILQTQPLEGVRRGPGNIQVGTGSAAAMREIEEFDPRRIALALGVQLQSVPIPGLGRE